MTNMVLCMSLILIHMPYFYFNIILSYHALSSKPRVVSRYLPTVSEFCRVSSYIQLNITTYQKVSAISWKYSYYCSIFGFLCMKIVLQKFNIKNDKLNSNVNISKILHLPFDMLLYSLGSIMVRCKMHRQSDSRSKVPVVQNRTPSTKK